MPARLHPSETTRAYHLNLAVLQQHSDRLLGLLGLDAAEMSVVLLDDAEMAAYNEQYRKKQGPTNVLAFPVEREAGAMLPEAELGDILVSVDTARREAVAEGISLHHRLARLIIHGLLHLIGYDHERSEDEALRMWDFEQQLEQRLHTARRTNMPYLSINVDHVATLRPARACRRCASARSSTA